ncbi:MAG: diaminopimelate epimerase [Bacteriovoracaceae bacterium]|jgi:diaminopimelate epimerase
MVNFWKYSATGNDFIVFDDREGKTPQLDWEALCHRETGLGADGILLLGKSEKADFKMTYLNADGGEVEMCGNGGRAISHFAKNELGIEPMNKAEYRFETLEGVYSSTVEDDFIRLNMTEFDEWKLIDISSFYPSEKSIYMKTGVPHCIYLVDSVDKIDLMQVSPPIRYNKLFEKGVNINFIEKVSDHHLKMRTYERGVEGETLACGTGATAAALASNEFFGWKDKVRIDAPGGELEIHFKGSRGDFSEIYLCGKTLKISSGSIDLKKYGRA